MEICRVGWVASGWGCLRRPKAVEGKAPFLAANPSFRPEQRVGQGRHPTLDDRTRAQLLQAMPSLKERAKTLIELIAGSYFIFADRPLENR